MNDRDPAVRRRLRDEMETLYVMFSDYRFVYFFLGFVPLTWRLFQALVGVLWLACILMIVLASYSIYLVLPDVSLALASLHTVALAIFTQWSFAIIVLGNKDLTKIIDKLKSGIYIYENEEDKDEQKLRIKENMTKEVKSKFDQVKYIIFAGFVSNTTMFTVTQYMSYDEKEYAYPAFINPYLAHVYYNPFASRSTPALVCTYLLHLLFVLFAYAAPIRVLGIYGACAMNMKVHFDILNESIGNLRERAYRLYLKRARQPSSREEAFGLDGYSKCLASCFRANIEHHQALLRFRDDTGFIIGNLFLQVFILAAIVYASMLYQLYQTLPSNVYMNYLCTFLAEQGYTFFLCVLGEEVITSSSHVYLSLYSVKWFNFDEKFKQTLLITMINTRIPVEYKALIMNVPASIVTFSNNLSMMYKITNVAKQSDILN